MIKALIVDDVDLARDAISVRLREENDIEVVGEASCGRDAVAAIRGLDPDLIFLDVQMPGIDGFEVLEAVRPAHVPSVIFVTAHDKYAVKAFEARALHFLLKPIEDDSFRDALQRARRELSGDGARRVATERMNELLEERARAESVVTPPASSQPSALTRFTVKDREDFLLINAADVDWIESAGNYAALHIDGRSFLIRVVLGELEEKLDPACFARISRSKIVNLERVEKMRPLWHGDFNVILKNGTSLRMSRRYRKRLIP
jgi:two-component system LytT family response regulator